MSRSISSRGRCLRPRTCPSASSPPSTALAASPSKSPASPAMPARCRCICARTRCAAAAEMVLAVERAAPDTRRHRGDGRADGGAARRRQRDPLGRHAVASTSAAPSDAVRNESVARLERQFHAIAERRGVSVQLDPLLRRAGRHLRALAGRSARGSRRRAAGIRPLRLPSGAGHDGLAMVALCPIAMLFVRCEGGISHNPAEAITAPRCRRRRRACW